MCLFIDRFSHPDYKPITLSEDLEVYKILEVRPFKKFTPFFYTRIKFGLKKDCTLPPFNLDEFTVNDSHIKRGDGYHAYLNLDAAYEDLLKLIQINKSRLSKMKLFKATIPEGSMVYYDSFNCICASQLIIHKKPIM